MVSDWYFHRNIFVRMFWVLVVLFNSEILEDRTISFSDLDRCLETVEELKAQGHHQVLAGQPSFQFYCLPQQKGK